MTYPEQLFKRFNEDYFNNRLWPLDIYFASLHIPEWGYCCRDYIMLSPVLKRYQLALEAILLHEMIHAYLDEDDHTPEFNKIQRKLNKRHFGDKGNHRIHYEAMIKDLQKRGVYDKLYL